MDKKGIPLDMDFEEIVNRVAQTDNKEVVQVSKEQTTPYTIDKLINEFESKAQWDDEGVEFWFARDMQELLEYEKWDKFTKVIKKAEGSCSHTDNTIENHFLQVGKMVKIGSKTTRKIEDYKLTRYACYLIAQNGDSRKKPVAFAQTYFAVQTRRREVEDLRYRQLTEEEKRILLRNEIKEHNKNLASAAKSAGVIMPLDYAIFQNAGYKGLYGGLDKRGIQRTKGLKKKQNILDHMGSEELAANLFRATQTEAKLKRDNVRGKGQANKTHYEVGQKVRKTIADLGGTMPEDLPAEEDIKKIERKNKKIAQQLAYKKKKGLLNN